MLNYYNYFTEIEEHFVRRRGKHLLVSPMDWGLIASWRDAGIPLHVVLRGIDIAMDGFFARRGGGTSKVNSLCYCHDSVMSEYARYLESRVGESTEDAAPTGDGTGSEKPTGPGREEVLGLISARTREIKSLVEKHYPSETPEGFQRVLQRLEELRQDVDAEVRVDAEVLDRDLGLIDRLLIEELRGLITAEEAEAWENEAKKELKVYRKRLPKDTYQKIYDNFMADKIHKKFGIGDFSLFHL